MKDFFSNVILWISTLSIPVLWIVVGAVCFFILTHKIYVQLISYNVGRLGGKGGFKAGLCVIIFCVALLATFMFVAGRYADLSQIYG